MRYKRFLISFEMLRDLLTEGDHKATYSVVKNAIPKDAKLVNLRHGWTNCLELLIESESFDEVPQGGIVPEFVPELTGERL